MTAPFISVTDLAAALHRTIDPDDALGEMACDAASQVVRDYCRQHINLVTDDEVLLDGTDTDAIMLPELPIVEVGPVLVEGTALTTDEWTLGDPNVGILYRTPATSKWTLGRSNVEVTYTHGWSVSTPTGVPSSLRIVALYVAMRIWDQGIVNTEGVGGYSASYSDSLITPMEKRIIDHYRQVHKG